MECNCWRFNLKNVGYVLTFVDRYLVNALSVMQLIPRVTTKFHPLHSVIHKQQSAASVVWRINFLIRIQKLIRAFFLNFKEQRSLKKKVVFGDFNNGIGFIAILSGSSRYVKWEEASGIAATLDQVSWIFFCFWFDNRNFDTSVKVRLHLYMEEIKRKRIYKHLFKFRPIEQVIKYKKN